MCSRIHPSQFSSYFHRAILGTVGECSVLCHCVGLHAVGKTVCQRSGLSGALAFSAPHPQLWLDRCPLWRSAAAGEEDGSLWTSLAFPWHAWSCAEALRPGWPWAPAGVVRLTAWEERERASVLVPVVAPWPVSDTPRHSWVFGPDKRKMDSDLWYKQTTAMFSIMEMFI